MMKKLQLFCLSLLSVISLRAQNEVKGRTCATPIPGAQWDAWFNAEVEKFKAQILNGNAKINTNYTIPVIVHVIHSGGAVGVGDNVSQAQVQDQISILNADYAGTGTNYTNCPAAFQPLLANTNIQWCLAVSNPTGGVLAQPGIDRVAATSIPGVTSVPPGGFTQSFIDQTIKPATIWNPTKYCNVWILQLQSGLLGYATFPAGTTLAGISGGGSATTDGVVIGHNYFGSVGSASASAPYNLGRTASHELGHWLGLRHVWGDGNCLTDYCNDTPWAKQANFGCPTVPAYVNRCGPGQSPNGEMVMNFMDYTDDPCMYMFTLDQRTRMQTAMSQGTYRNLLGTHGLCALPTPTPAPANAQFDITGSNPCVGSPFTPNNTSTGGPTPTFTWSSVPGATYNPNPYVASPAITFTAPGNYTLTLVASNSLATSTYSQVILNVGTCPKPPVCLDTLRMITPLDTLTTYITPTSSFVLACQSGWTGFLTGTNCYKDKSFAQWYAGTTYSDTPNPQVNSMIVLFNQGGTKATATTSATQIYCRVYGGTSNAGPASSLSYVSDSLGRIAASTATNQVQFAGNPAYIFPGNTVIVHKFNFPAPVVIPTSGFFGAVETPYSSIQDSIQIFSDTKTSVTNDSSAWVLLYGNNWRTLRYQRQAKVQLAIFPQITCRPVAGIEEKSEFKSNITIMPNPSAGLFSLVFTFPTQQKVKIRIYNSLGQIISTDEIENVGSNYFDVDLRTVPDGVYFLEVSNSREKITKKLIITK